MTDKFNRISFAQDIIFSRYDPAAFVGRAWLVEEIARLRTDPQWRQLVIVGEPGTGKSAFMAYLAEDWNCPRHFIRVDSIGGVSGLDPRSFLVSLGAQLCEKYGEGIFGTPNSGTTEVTVGWAKDQAEVVGRFVEEVHTLPFLSQPKRDVSVRVAVAGGASRVVGESIKRLVDVTLALDELTLLHIALLNPLRKLQQLHPQELVVVLVDALDEGLQYPGKQILDVLPRPLDADFPPNLRLVMTSRQGDHLVRFRAQDLLYLDDTKKGYWQASRRDTQAYILKQLKRPALAELFKKLPENEREAYITTVRDNSDGNFLFLYYFFNELSDAVAKGNSDLKVIRVPQGLDEIYQYFAVAKIRDKVSDSIQFTALGTISDELVSQWQNLPGVKQVQVAGQEITLVLENINMVLGPLLALSMASGVQVTNPLIHQGAGGDAWEKKYLPLLGVLAVVQEAVSREQLAGFAGVEVADVDRVIAQLKQFLDEVSDERKNYYRFYHTSFSEYLLDSSRNRDWPLDGPEYHYQIASYYRGSSASWDEVEWGTVGDTYSSTFLAAHLDAAGHGEELQQLLVAETKQHRNAWYEAKKSRGDIIG